MDKKTIKLVLNREQFVINRELCEELNGGQPIPFDASTSTVTIVQEVEYDANNRRLNALVELVERGFNGQQLYH